jgi:hypothetical protein
MSSILLAACLLFVQLNSESGIAGGGGTTGVTGVIGGVTGFVTGSVVAGGTVLLHAKHKETTKIANRLFLMALVGVK